MANSSDELGKFEQVMEAKGRAAGSDRDVGICRENAGPLSGQRDQPTSIVVEEHVMFAPIAAIHHERELASAERVEGMGDLEGLAVNASIGCT